MYLFLTRASVNERKVMFILGEYFSVVWMAPKVYFGKPLGLVLIIIYFMKIINLVKSVN